MARMDVSPRELRDIEIGSEFRGYNRDEVDELLERAATTIEGLTDRVLQLTDRINALGSAAPTATASEAPAAAKAAEPIGATVPPPPQPAAPPVSDGGDLIQRTLLLAQKTADDTVAEAEEHARKVRADADAHAAAVVGDAEARARTIQDEHKAKLEHEVIDLSGRRDALLADIDTLSTYDENFRAKIRVAIEADLAAISERPAPDPGPRPGIHQIQIPSPPELADPASGAAGLSAPTDVPAIGRGAPASAGSASASAGEPDSVISLEESPSAGDAGGQQDDASTGSFFGGDDKGAPAFDAKPAVVSTETASVWDVRTAAADAPAWLAPSPGEGEPVGSEVLDDDAFFATLRDAVRDDAPPLGTDEGGGSADEGFYDDDGGEGRFGGVFRRRR
ncbi:MAG: DivIVA protein [Actinomycetia bacterium]|nr:DivIVA protein [Actinomycetes bacterium]